MGGGVLNGAWGVYKLQASYLLKGSVFENSGNKHRVQPLNPGLEALKCTVREGGPEQDNALCLCTYIYICCMKGIWSPRGGDLVP